MEFSGTDTDAPSLQLLLPGLFGVRGPESEPQKPVQLPALETLLTRGERQVLPVRGLESVLFSLFGAEIPADADLPVAPITRVLDLGVVDNGWWIRADPVHLNPQRDQLILSDSFALDLTQEEANQLAAEISEVYAPDGWTVKAPRPSRWYIKPSRPPNVTTTPLPDVVGRDIHPYLPRGPEAKTWHTILNEIQIVLHASQVNEQRERAGKLPVNSLWFWGGGCMPRIQSVEWGGLWSTEPVSLTLARLAAMPTQSTPADFNEWQRQVSGPKPHLVVLDGLRASVLYRNPDSWASLMEQLERDWFAPLLNALRGHRLGSVILLTDAGVSFRIAPSMARRWWRFKKSFSAFH